MATQLEKETKGAWIIHHGRKIALDINAPAEFPVLDETAKAAELLIRLGQSELLGDLRKRRGAPEGIFVAARGS